MHPATDGGRLDVHLDDPLALHQLAAVGGEIIKPCAETDDAIGLGDQIIGGRRGKCPENVDVMGMAAKQPLGFQRRGKRRLQPVGKPDQLVTRANRSASGQDQRAAGRGDHADGLVQNIAFGHATRRGEDVEHLDLMFHLLPHEVGRHVQNDGAAFDLGPVEGARNVFADSLGRAHLLEPGAGRLDQFTLVNALRVTRVDCRCIAGKKNHRNMSPHAFGQRRDAIGQRRAVGDGGNTDLACDMGISQRHQYRTALMCRRHKPAAAVAHETVDHEQVGIAHQPEHGLDPVVRGRAGNGLIEVHLAAHRHSLQSRFHP